MLYSEKIKPSNAFYILNKCKKSKNENTNLIGLIIQYNIALYSHYTLS